MTPEQYQRVKELFGRALGLAPAARAAWLAEQADGDEVVRGEVQEMLAEAEAPHTAAAQLDGGGAKMLRAEMAAQEVPRQIGAYRIMRRIGQGGMGTVYEAEQQNPRRRVALKVIRAGLGHGNVVRRFQREASALGLLQHAGIGQVYEAGFAEIDRAAQPYIAMEYVDGVPLDRSVRERGASARQIIELAAQVCDALHYAHEKGVVHRDLKPDNILVDAAGNPKILDFGVARIVDADVAAVTLQTEAGQLIGTLSYMSPEQVRGRSGEIDRRSDIYAVGVILHELLAGEPPHDVRNQTIPEAARIICEHEATRLGSINTKYRGDVETIVAKALEKDAARRYATAGALAADLRRYLADEPIEARAPSTLYQWRKFARRNKALVGGLAATLAALVVGLGLATAGFVSARRERDEAERERDAKQAALRLEQQSRQESDAVTAFLAEMFASADPEKKGRDVTVRETLDDAAARVGERFADQALVEAKLRATIGKTYVSLGDYARAEPQVRAAIEIMQRERGEKDEETIALRESLGEVLYFLGRHAEAVGEFEAVCAHYGQVLAPGDRRRISCLNNLAFMAMKMGRYAEAERFFGEALAAMGETPGPDDPAVLDIKSNVAALYIYMNRPEEAERHFVDVIAQSERVRGAEHPATMLLVANLASAYLTAKRPADAIPLLRRALDVQTRQLGEDHSKTLITLHNLGRAYQDAARHAEAVELLRGGLARCRAKYGETDRNTILLMETLAINTSRAGNASEAEALFEEALRLSRAVHGEDGHAALVTQGHFLDHYLLVGDFARALELAEDLLRRALAREAEPLSELDKWRVDPARCLIGLGRYEEAKRVLDEAYEAASEGSKRYVIPTYISLYEMWEAAEPEQGHEASAAEWRGRLEVR